MRGFKRKCGSFLVLTLGSAGAHADILLYANLSNTAENPPMVPTTLLGAPRPSSFGTAEFVLNAAGTAVSFTSTVFNIDFTGTQTADINDNLIAAHIHASPTVTPTTNGGVVWGFFGMPFNDNNPNNTVFTPFATGVGGTISRQWDNPEGNNTTLADQLQNILAGPEPSTMGHDDPRFHWCRHVLPCSKSLTKMPSGRRASSGLAQHGQILAVQSQHVEGI
jgi:hypothetical protein